MIRPLLAVLFTLFFSFTFGQAQLVSGRVTSASDPNGLPGVNVVVKGTTQGVITDVEGRFSLEVPTNSIIVFSFVGYKSMEITYTGQTNLDIVMEDEARELSEIVDGLLVG
jgi:TonB-dependent starch-binding outer membrane protein SusC